MDRKQAVNFALQNMELEGFVFTAQEMEMWEKIKAGELPFSYARQAAVEFDRVMRAKHPELYAVGDEEESL